jgi:hypothetical protein
LSEAKAVAPDPRQCGRRLLHHLPDLGGAAKLRAMEVPVRTLMAFEGH